MSQRVPLIVDPDQKFLESCMSDPKAQMIPPMMATSGKDAQTIISDTKVGLLGVFINPKVASPSGLSVIRCCHLRRPGTPVYLLMDNAEITFDNEQLHQLGIQKLLQKPVTYTDLAKLVLPTRHLFEAAEALKLSEKNQEPVNTEVSVDDKEFIPIHAENYLSGSTSFFDVYVRLSKGNYIKILKAGDNFSVDRIAEYLKKGLKLFYIKKNAQEHYLRYCDKLTAALVNNPNTSVETKINQTLNHGEEVIKFLRQEGLNENYLNYAFGFLTNVKTIIQSQSLEQNKVISTFISNLMAYDHAVSTCMMTALMLRALKSDYTVIHNMVGLASLFHDIGLYQLPEAVHGEDESKMTPEQVVIFRTHPELSVNLLRGIQGISETTLQIIEQHHRRKNGQGFPQKTSSANQLQMAEVLGIADDFSNVVTRSKETKTHELITAFGKQLPNMFSGSIVTAFTNLFSKRR